MDSTTPPTQAAGPAPPAMPQLVLQIEDNPTNAKVVELLLARRSDIKVLSAANGPLGIEMACTHRPQVILMDMRMPGMNGIATMAVLRSNPATANIPVIALSSNAFQSEIKKCMDAGAFQYLTKPYKIEQLMALIDLALQFAAKTQPYR
jgi:CheY-like chemotaxis protein